MQLKSFSKIDGLMGWLLFLVAVFTYGSTIEPTASLWDCPEFITCGYKLEIGHPPGAPFFMLTANLFSQFASDPSEVARMVNLLSALLSAGTILFLFWTITHFMRKLMVHSDTISFSQLVVIESSGVVGCLAYTFSDTFWFSAVEGEVYAYSSFLTAVVFWLILKWENHSDSPVSDRWLILMAYLIGLSVGVHLLCLLCIPPMVLVGYYRKKEVTSWKGTSLALLLGFCLVGITLYGLVPGVVKMGEWFELFFVNVCSLPYHTGLVIFILLLTVGMLVWIRRSKHRLWHTTAWCVMMFMIGYSSYAVIFIRSAANPPMDENSPDNIFALESYLGREQYGDKPLLYGPAYTSEVEREQQGDYLVPKSIEGKAVYQPSPDRRVQHYDLVTQRKDYIYKENMLFPRMYSSAHGQTYENWLGGVDKRNGLPTQLDNIRFFLSYQVNFMYMRYFLWNFVGRQNNIQGNGEAEHGNWITGIPWVDDWLLDCDTSKMPADLMNNKGRNVFYGLPLLLGLLGMVWQIRQGRRGSQQWNVVMLLFLMTGLAIVVYLNQTPNQPRERDYAYAGSFYAFAIWIGMGVAAVKDMLGRCRLGERSTTALAAIACVMVPLQMVSQTWDDHDRSNRYTCRDFGANYLQSMQQKGHPVIFTNGDNDTFPLWYDQEVEGVRTDARVCNLSYAQTDWYIDQMRRPAYHSPALPISWQRKDYTEGTNEYMTVDPQDSFEVNYAGKKMVIRMQGQNYLTKSDLMVLDMINNNPKGRPLYLSISMGDDVLPFLRDHLVLEGLVYRLVPDSGGMKVDVDRLYQNVMYRFKWGGLNRKGLYVDPDAMRMAHTHQLILGILIDSLMERGDMTRAVKVADLWQREMPDCNVPYSERAVSMAMCYYRAGQTKKADDIVRSLLERGTQWLRWIDTIEMNRRNGSAFSLKVWLMTMQQALIAADMNHREQILNQYGKVYETYARQYQINRE